MPESMEYRYVFSIKYLSVSDGSEPICVARHGEFSRTAFLIGGANEGAMVRIAYTLEYTD